MLVADTALGHRDDPAVAERLAESDAHRVVLSDVERRRSRVRTETEAGRDLGVVVGRDLVDGDVLEAEDGSLVVVELSAVEAVAVPVAECDPTTTLELGHALGNRHRDLAVRDGEALIPTDGARSTVESVVGAVLPDASYRCTEVSPATFDDGPTPDHDHGAGAEGHDHTGVPLDGPRTLHERSEEPNGGEEP